MLYTCTIPRLIKNRSSGFGTEAKTLYDRYSGGDLDLKVMHIQGHRMSCSALLLHHIKFGENPLDGMGTVAKKLI